MKLLVLLLTSASLGSCEGQAREAASQARPTTTESRIPRPQEPGPPPDSLDVDYQLRGDCYAYSSPENAQKSNGEAHSDNLPRRVAPSFSRQAFFLAINPVGLTGRASGSGRNTLCLVNTTRGLVKLDASDSRLNIVAEALNAQNEWVPITYLPASGCGNSYHTVALGPGEYWSFAIPTFKGKLKTRLRYTLLINESRSISSNEIVAYLNPGQLAPGNKQGHTPVGIMDPYKE